MSIFIFSFVPIPGSEKMNTSIQLVSFFIVCRIILVVFILTINREVQHLYEWFTINTPKEIRISKLSFSVLSLCIEGTVTILKTTTIKERGKRKNVLKNGLLKTWRNTLQFEPKRGGYSSFMKNQKALTLNTAITEISMSFAHLPVVMII